MDLRRYGKRAGTRCGKEQRNRVALLDPAIAVDPEVEVEAREVARKERARRQGLVATLQLVTAGEVEVPRRLDDLGPLRSAPRSLLFGQPAIEHAQRQRAAFRRGAQRGDAILHQLEVAGITAGDRDGSSGHPAKMADPAFAVACHCATVSGLEDT